MFKSRIEKILENMLGAEHEILPPMSRNETLLIQILEQGMSGGGEATVETVTGTDPVITAQANTRYICGEVATLSITPVAEGITDVLFTSGTTATVVNLPQTVKMPEWFTVEANKTYEINILDGVYGVVMSWD